MPDENTQNEVQITTADRFRKAILMAAIVIGIGWAAGFC
jgi:hypothetical protein